MDATIGAASNSQNHQRQMDILDYSKTLSESALQLMYAAKEGGGNPKVLYFYLLKVDTFNLQRLLNIVYFDFLEEVSPLYREVCIFASLVELRLLLYYYYLDFQTHSFRWVGLL